MAAARTVTERIRGRVLEIEIGEAEGIGWFAVGIVTDGLPHETGLRFEAAAASRDDAEARLKAEIEAYFA